MTQFRECLTQLLDDIPHSVSACIMGVDGIPIDIVALSTTHPSVSELRSKSSLASDAIDHDALFVEYGTLVSQFQTTAQMFAAGELEEIAARTDGYACLMRPISQDIFLALMLLPNAHMGHGRHLLRILAPQLKPLLQ